MTVSADAGGVGEWLKVAGGTSSVIGNYLRTLTDGCDLMVVTTDDTTTWEVFIRPNPTFTLRWHGLLR